MNDRFKEAILLFPETPGPVVFCFFFYNDLDVTIHLTFQLKTGPGGDKNQIKKYSSSRNMKFGGNVPFVGNVGKY
jgi:hypothetical protein